MRSIIFSAFVLSACAVPASAAQFYSHGVQSRPGIVPDTCSNAIGDRDQAECQRKIFKLSDLRLTLEVNKIRQSLDQADSVRSAAFQKDQRAWQDARDNQCPKAVSARPGTDAYQSGLYRCLSDVTDVRRTKLEGAYPLP